MITAQDTALIARKLFESFNRRDIDQLASLTLDGSKVINVPLDLTLTGPTGLKGLLQNLLTAFPDGKIEIENLVASEEWVAIELIARGTHKGVLQGPSGPIPPTHRRIEIHGVNMLHIRNGKIAEQRLFFDTATMLRELGLPI